MQLAKPALLLLGMVQEKERGAYEILKKLEQMDVKWWFPIGDSTIYATMRNLEKKGYITGSTKKDGRMPEKTIYGITPLGEKTLKAAVVECLKTMDFDTTYFAIAMRYQRLFTIEELRKLLQERLAMLEEYQAGIAAKAVMLKEQQAVAFHIGNVLYMGDVVEAQIKSVKRFLEATDIYSR